MVAGDGSPSAGSTGVAWKQLQEHASIFALDEVVICMVTTRPPKTIVKSTALGPVANTDTKLLIYGLFQKGRVLAQDGREKRVLLREHLQEGLTKAALADKLRISRLHTRSSRQSTSATPIAIRTRPDAPTPSRRHAHELLKNIALIFP